MVLGAVIIIIVGFLVVNYFKDKRSQITPVALSTTASTKSRVQKTHTVIKGETLWAISENVYGSGYNWTDIYKANNLKTEQIEIGQVLVLPNVASKQPTATKQVFSIGQVPQNHTTVSEATYTVVRGDSLWKIAIAEYGNGYKWTLIAKANNLKNPNIIYSGNVLTLPR